MSRFGEKCPAVFMSEMPFMKIFIRTVAMRGTGSSCLGLCGNLEFPKIKWSSLNGILGDKLFIAFEVEPQDFFELAAKLAEFIGL